MANQARNILPLFSSSSSRRWREHRTRRSFSSCRYSGQTHPGGPSPAFPLGPVFFFSSIFTVGSLCLFLVCFAAVSCRMSELHPPPPPPRKFSPAFASRQLLLQAEIVVDVHIVLSLLLSLCLQPAATDCSSCCKWRVGILDHAISKNSNRKVQLPKPLGRKTVPLQQQRAATGAQWVRTS